MDNSSKVLLPNDVRRLLNVDNKEIVELIRVLVDCKFCVFYSLDNYRLT